MLNLHLRFITFLVFVLSINSVYAQGDICPNPSPREDLTKILTKLTAHFKYNTECLIFDSKIQGAVAHFRYDHVKKRRVRTICIDYTYYDNLFKKNRVSEKERTALFYWIIGHEFAHCYYNHVEARSKTFITKTYHNELLADELGGQVVSKFTTVDIDFFDKTLPKFLKRLKLDGTIEKSRLKGYADVKYRMIVAKGGWLKWQIDKRFNRSKKITINDRSYYVSKNYNDFKVVEISENKEYTGFGYHIFNNQDCYYGLYYKGEKDGAGVYRVHQDKVNPLKIYLGQWEDGNKSGYGIQIENEYLYYEGKFGKNYKNGQGEEIILLNSYSLERGVYSGNFKNGKRNGLGKFKSELTKVTYTGDWENNERHGCGCEIHIENDNPVIKKMGIWENNNFKKAENCM